jgi:hypothetical protein
VATVVTARDFSTPRPRRVRYLGRRAPARRPNRGFNSPPVSELEELLSRNGFVLRAAVRVREIIHFSGRAIYCKRLDLWEKSA